MARTFKIAFFAVMTSLILISCGGSDSTTANKVTTIEDLPFAQAPDAKAYADLILKAIKTNREKPIKEEFVPQTPVNIVQLNRIVGMYSTAIGGKDWEFHDFHILSESDDLTKGFDYAWLDKKGRLGLQIYVLPKEVDGRFYIEKLDFQSRLDVIDSVTFPAGTGIEDYKKIDYDWAAN